MADRKTDSLKRHVNTTHEHFTCDKVDQGIEAAADGALFIRGLVASDGEAKALSVAQEAGFDPTQASELLGLADIKIKDRLPPSGLVRAMLEKSHADRAASVKEAVCASETSRWVDGLADDGKERKAPSTRELIKAAQEEKNPYRCFLLAVQIANRSVKTEFVGKVALFSMSEAFGADLITFATSAHNSRAYKSVRDLFGPLEKIVHGHASDEEKQAFIDALSKRAESALGLDEGGMWKNTHQGPDAEAMLPEMHGRTTIGVMYATANSSNVKGISTAGSLRRNWGGSASKADAQQIILVGESIVQADANRMQYENRPLASIALDIAVAQAAQTVLASVHDDIVPSILDGRAKVDGLFLGTGEPFVFDQGMLGKVRQSIMNIKDHGYPPNTERGREAWVCTLGVISSWALNHPESFPWFRNSEMESWISDCPLNAHNEITDAASTSASHWIDSNKEKAIARVSERRAQRAIAEQKTKRLPAFDNLVKQKAQKQVEELVGENKQYGQDTYDAQCLRAMLKAGDLEGIRLVAEDGKRARTVRESRRRAKPNG